MDGQRLCPRDATPLSEVSIDGLVLDSCDGCGGIWFDVGELREAEAQADADLAWLDFTLWREEENLWLTPTPMQCPESERCGGRLGSLLYHDTGVLVHMCANCHGTWLDHGDLELIVSRLRQEMNDLETSALVRASLAEAARLVAHPGRLAGEWKDLRGLVGLLGRRLGTAHRNLIARLGQAAQDTPFQ